MMLVGACLITLTPYVSFKVFYLARYCMLEEQHASCSTERQQPPFLLDIPGVGTRRFSC